MNKNESIEIYNDVMNRILDKSVETAMAQLQITAGALCSTADAKALARQSATLALMAYQELGLQLHQQGPVVRPPGKG